MIRNFILMTAAACTFTAAAASCGSTTVKLADLETTQASAETTAETTLDNEIVGAIQSVAEEETEPEPVLYEIDIEPPEGYTPTGSCVLENFETVMQEPELPTGCEVTSLAQTLNYLGFSVDKVELADEFMPIDFNGTYTMNDAYIGEPKSTRGMGCLAPVIVQTADDYFASVESPCYAADLSESSLNSLFWQIDEGRPVIVWVTIDMRPRLWYYQFTAQSGEEVWFNYYQHCVTVYGYDMENSVVHVADPLVGNTTYDLDKFEEVYEAMREQAVVICGDSSTEGTYLPRSDKPQSEAVSRNQQEAEKATEEETSENAEINEETESSTAEEETGSEVQRGM